MRTDTAGATVKRLRGLIDQAFEPISGQAFGNLARLLYVVRVLVGATALVASFGLPEGTDQRRLIVLLVGGIYIPYSLALMATSRRFGERKWLRVASLLGDMGIVFLFHATVPYTKVVALFGYLLILSFYTYLAGWPAGAMVSVLAMSFVMAAESVHPAGERLDLYTTSMFGVVLVSMTLLVSGASREQRALTRRLAISSSRLEEAQQIANLGNWVWKITSGEISWSDEMYQIYGYEKDRAALSLERVMERVVPEDSEVITVRIAEALERGEDHQLPDVEYQIELPGGERKTLYGRGRLEFENGIPTRMIGTVLDVTERKEAERTMEAAYEREKSAADRLRELDEMKNAFLTAISHDLRTPLTAILGFARTLQSHFAELTPASMQEITSRIEANAERLESMLINILDLDRLSRGIIQPKRRPVEISSVVKETIGSLEVGSHPLTMDLSPTIANIDVGQFERIVENLVVNAIRHTPGDTPIRVSVDRNGSGIVLKVEDQGAGVPDDLKDVIFEPFKRGYSSRSPGTGVGLSVVSRFAQLHEGRAWVEDGLNGGAVFNVFLNDGGEPISNS